MRLVVDMNLSTDWVGPLQQAGFDVAHWSSIGPADASDADIMAWARENDAVVLTRDLDFGELVVRGASAAPSIVQLRVAQATPERHLPGLSSALTIHGDDIRRGALVTVGDDRVRVRRLVDDDDDD